MLVAEEASAAGYGEGHDDAITHGQTCIVLADVDQYAHTLVPKDVALLHGRDVAIVEVQVAPLQTSTHGATAHALGLNVRVRDARQHGVMMPTF